MTKNINLDELKVTIFNSANARRHKDGTPMATKDETGQLWIPVDTVIEHKIAGEIFHIRWGKFHQTVIDSFIEKTTRRVQDDVKTSDHGDDIGRLNAVKKRFEEYESGAPLAVKTRATKVSSLSPVDQETLKLAKAFIEEHILADCKNVRERADHENNLGWYSVNEKGTASVNEKAILDWAKHADQSFLGFVAQAESNLAFAQETKDKVAAMMAKLGVKK